jgi:hypothetical protein
MLQRTTNFYRARFLRLRFALVLAELAGFDAARLLALADCGGAGRGAWSFSATGATRPAAAPETAICVAAKSISPVLNARPVHAANGFTNRRNGFSESRFIKDFSDLRRP